MSNAGTELQRLLDIMARLRAEGGCPWDREQDLRSLRPYLIEETYEVLDEMDRVGYGGLWAPLCEELGDLLFQIVFHAQLADERKEFGFADICKAISDKITRRHPHVFGENSTKAGSSTQVLENWARLKAAEKKAKFGDEGSVLDGVPTAAPALMRAERLTEKASRVGFDWPDLRGVREKLNEEIAELDVAIARGNRDELEHELGDVLFTLANLSRFTKTPPEDALRQANHRFTSRFRQVEAGLRADGIPFGKASLEQMEAHWTKAKQAEKSLPPPRALSRSSLKALRLHAEPLSAAEPFWDRVAPLLGWEKQRSAASTLTYSDGALAFHFSAAHKPSAAHFVLEAPSETALVLFRSALSKMDVAFEEEDRGISFRSPEGNFWSYTFS